MNMPRRPVRGLRVMLLAAGIVVGAAQPGCLPWRHRRWQGDVAPQQRGHAARQRGAAPGGNFFTVDLQQARIGLRGRALGAPVRWCSASFRTGCACGCRSTRPVALWGHRRRLPLVNSFGEVFEANVGDVEQDDLPRLLGPGGSSAAGAGDVPGLGSRCWSRWTGDLVQLELSGRGSWQATLDKGAVIELGRGTPRRGHRRARSASRRR
jgi:cell division protein FtsQ